MNEKEQLDMQEPEQDLISSEDVLAVVNGDQVALVEQLERAKEVAAEQLKHAHDTSQSEEAKKKLEEELKKKEAILAEAKRRREEAKKKAQEAKEEAERKRKEAEAEKERLLLEQQKQAEAERQKQLALEEEKRRREQEKIQHKQQLEQQKKEKAEQKKLAREQKILERENAKKAKEEAKKQKLLARQQAKEQKMLAKKQIIEQRKLAKKKAEEQAIRQKEYEKSQILAQQQALKHQQEMARQQAIQEQRLAEQRKQEQEAYAKKQALEQKRQAEEVALEQKVALKEAKEKAKQEKKANSNAKYIMTAIFLVSLILMVIFLPNISELIANYKREKALSKAPVLTTGVLSCKMNKNDDKFDYYYTADFEFKDSQMDRLTFNTTIKGDKKLDELELTEMKNSCELLRKQVANMAGVRVSCSLSEGVYKNNQVLNYAELKSEDVTTAYLEAGGTFPNYEYKQSIDEIEKEMRASNYTCERHN